MHFIAALICLLPVSVPPPAKSMVVELKKSNESFEAALKKEVEKAKAAKLRPYIEFTAAWCPPCNAFKKFIHDPLMEDALAGTYLILVDFDAWSDEANALGVRGIPTWIELDANGKPTSRRITSSVWGDDIPSNMAPPLKRFFATRGPSAVAPVH